MVAVDIVRDSISCLMCVETGILPVNKLDKTKVLMDLLLADMELNIVPNFGRQGLVHDRHCIKLFEFFVAPRPGSLGRTSHIPRSAVSPSSEQHLT
jgi:hypothetical protein